MLIFPEAGLVYLAVPKTGTMAVHAMLHRVAWKGLPVGRHTSLSRFRRQVAPYLQAEFGRPFETLCAVREPLDRLHSWYRYRQRDRVAGAPVSTRGMSFDAFVAAVTQPAPPSFAEVGRQDVFAGWDGTMAGVDHVFDYAQLALMVAFLSQRLQLDLTLPRRNVSTGHVGETGLSAETADRLAQVRAGEFAFYRAVSQAGHLRRPNSSGH